MSLSTLFTQQSHVCGIINFHCPRASCWDEGCVKRWSSFGWAIWGVAVTLEEEPQLRGCTANCEQQPRNGIRRRWSVRCSSFGSEWQKHPPPEEHYGNRYHNAALISSDHIFQNAFNWFISTHFQNVTVDCGEPRGSILGWIIFEVYMLPLGRIIRTHRVDLLSYADDTLLYLSIKLDVSGQRLELKIYLKDIQIMDDSRFPLA